MNESTKMRGLVLDQAAPLGVHMREDLDIPQPGPGQVRVRISHTSVNGHEFELAQNRFVRLTQLFTSAPGEVRTGLEFSGVVDTTGALFERGQLVMGYVDVIAGWKPHAEYIVIPEAYIAPAPRGIALAEAAALPMSGQTALVALRDVAEVRAGQEVLILGASGGVGVMAVQLARILGARITAVASSKHHARLARLGAHRTIDYRETPVGQMSGAFDAILDFSSTTYLKDVAHVLAPDGVFIPGDPMRNLLDIMLHKRARWLLVDKGDTALLTELGAWAEQGELEAVVNDVFTWSDWGDAVAKSHERGHIGRTIMEFDVNHTQS